MLKSKKWQLAEQVIFTVITIGSMIPLLTTQFFPSLDGASHLSNVNIINQLIFYNNKLFQQFFILNPEPVPNWTSHFLLALLTLVFPAFLAEKILVILLLAGIPLAFRRLLLTISPEKVIYAYLVFPFTHSMFLFFGFFNFCLSILFSLITLNYWLTHEQHGWKLKSMLMLTFLIAVTYFSHVVIFGVLLIAIAARVVVISVNDLIRNEKPWGKTLQAFFTKAVVVTGASLVPLFLFVYFFYSRPGTRQINFIPREELIQYLIRIRPLISFNTDSEGKITIVLFFILSILLLAGTVFFIVNLIKKPTFKEKIDPEGSPVAAPRRSMGPWLASTAVILLMLFFLLPDAYGTASYTNLRLEFALYLVVILWITTFRMPQWIGIAASIGAIYVHVHLLGYYTPIVRDLGKMATACHQAAEKIQTNSLVLPIYVNDNWFTGHFVDYISVDKPVLMVYNYECQTGYFPTLWNRESKPNFYLGSPSNPEACINFEENKGRPSLPLDYVFVVGNYDPAKDAFFSTLHRILQTYYIPVYTTQYCTLYHKKP